ncbi:MAG: cell division protein FtsZ [Bacteroidota bacterium]|nr:cell division protein FtsZ [Bacteroidota bacterium]
MDNNILDIQATSEEPSYIKIIGVGGAGTNAVNHMYNNKITGVEFIVCNTDRQSLEKSPVPNKIQLGRGLGAGNNPERAKVVAQAAKEEIKQALTDDTRMLFIAAGMGGGTGTGASPVIASIAKEIELPSDETLEGEEKDEILVVAIVTIPFAFEGRRRREQAIAGIEELKQYVDSMIIVNTDKLKERGKMNMKASFALADDILLTAAKGVSEMMTANESYIHVDFKDVQSVMKHSGVALMGSGEGDGEDRAYKAIEAATTCDLLNNNDLSQTKNILMYLACSSDPELEINNEEVEVITDYLQSITNPEVNVIWGYGYDDTLEGKVAVTIVATGFESKEIYSPIERGNAVARPKAIEQKPVVETPRFSPIPNSAPTSNPIGNITRPTTPITINENTTQPTTPNPVVGNNTGVQNFATPGRTIGELRTDGTIIDYSQNKPQEEKKHPLEPFMENVRNEQSVPQNNNSNLEQTQAYDSQGSTTTISIQPEAPKNKKSLNDIIQGDKTVNDATHWERVRIMREMLCTREGVKQITNMHSVDANIDDSFATNNQTPDRLAINSNGNLVKMENPVLDGPVD